MIFKPFLTTRESKTYNLIQGIFLLWLLFILVPVFFQIGEEKLVLHRIQCEFFCHQKLERFLEIKSYYPFVCGRCLGIYSSLFFFSFFRLKKLRPYVYYFFIPALLDKVLEHFSAYTITNELRFLSGLFIGIAFLILIQEKMLKKSPRTKHVDGSKNSR